MSAQVSINSGLTYKATSPSPVQTEQAPSGGPTQQTNTLTTATCHPDEQSVPTTAGGTAVPYGPVTVLPGWSSFENVDPANTVQIGLVVSGTFYPFADCLVGDAPAQFCIASGVQLYWRANSAAAKMRDLICER